MAQEREKKGRCARSKTHGRAHFRSFSSPGHVGGVTAYQNPFHPFQRPLEGETSLRLPRVRAAEGKEESKSEEWETVSEAVSTIFTLLSFPFPPLERMALDQDQVILPLIWVSKPDSLAGLHSKWVGGGRLIIGPGLENEFQLHSHSLTLKIN